MLSFSAVLLSTFGLICHLLFCFFGFVGTLGGSSKIFLRVSAKRRCPRERRASHHTSLSSNLPASNSVDGPYRSQLIYNTTAKTTCRLLKSEGDYRLSLLQLPSSWLLLSGWSSLPVMLPPPATPSIITAMMQAPPSDESWPKVPRRHLHPSRRPRSRAPCRWT